jgi:spermidine synthase
MLYVSSRHPPQFALAVLAVLLATPAVHSAERVLERHRSFFGVHSVLRDDTGQFHVLMHGITIHGAQYIDPAKRTKTTTYFHADSPIGHVLSVLGRSGALGRVAVVGMGTGTLACHRAPGRQWTFYELDPVVVRLAKDARYFDFLARCAPQARIEIGDGRLTLMKAPAHAYDLIVIDTFSSDAIPAHMITREALALYLSRVVDGGLVAFHVTNEYLDLLPVLARLAADAGVTAYAPGPRFEIALDDKLAALPSSWVLMSRDASRFAPLAAEEGWVPLPPPPPGRVWTDDFSNVPGALK